MRRVPICAIPILALALIAPGCASRQQATRPSIVDAPATDDLTALIRHGCYRCLEEAFTDAHARNARQHAFEAAALLVLRSKELGLPYDEWLERARSLAGIDDSSSLILGILDAIPPDPLSGNLEAALDVRGRSQVRASLTGWREALQTGPGSELFRAYLDISLVCAFGALSQNEQSFSAPIDPVAAAPLYQYRLGICDSRHAARLASLRAGDPAFVDADYALGRYAVEDPVNPDHDEGLDRFQSAAAAFPGSSAIATIVGNVYRAWEEWENALTAYNRAIAIVPGHPEAIIGRTMSLSRLSRPHEAIETATRLIDGGQWRLGEAYYWRAWNRLSMAEYQLARSDADRARTLMSNAAVFVLSGVIEWRLRRLTTAEREFEQALAIDLGECEAAFNLGVVRDELAKQPEALAAFTQARQCYELSMTLRREAIAKILSGAGAESTKTRAAAQHERALRDFETRHREVLRAIEVLKKADKTSAG